MVEVGDDGGADTRGDADGDVVDEGAGGVADCDWKTGGATEEVVDGEGEVEGVSSMPYPVSP
ncbi:hypothetical protein [Streptomyces sp. KL116D]|uniref:hypothetical protein n=1 Tax=Streptomyces sp. KL116D TaxID=3045152 RepID=UPI003556081E